MKVVAGLTYAWFDEFADVHWPACLDHQLPIQETYTNILHQLATRVRIFSFDQFQITAWSSRYFFRFHTAFSTLLAFDVCTQALHLKIAVKMSSII
jgi:hypothetical protein